MTVGDKVKAFCDENKISLYEFSKKVAIAPVGLSRIVNDDRMLDPWHLKRIAGALGITVDELIEDYNC